MIGFGVKARTVVRLWTGDDVTQVSVMRLGMKARTEETCWAGGEGTLNVMIGFGIGAENFATWGALFVATSFDSSGSQKEKYSEDSSFGSGDVGDVVTFDREVTSFVSSALEFQKKERLEMSFICGDIGDVMNFVGDVIQSDLTSWIRVSCDALK